MSEPRFQIAPLQAPADPGSTVAQLQDRFDWVQDVSNTLNDEAALERLLLHGVGRLENQGCEISLGPDGVLRLNNGYFLAGAGLEEDDAGYFVGARLVRVNGAAGWLELTGDDAPTLNAASGVFGFMSAYGDVQWAANASANGALSGRWCIGKAVTGADGITSVDADAADIVPTLATLRIRMAALLAAVQNGSGGSDSGSGSGTGAAFASLLPISPTNATDTLSYVDSADNALAVKLRDQTNSGVVGVNNESPIRGVNIHKLIASAVDQNPEFAPRFIAAINMPHATGNGQQWGDENADIVIVGGNMEVDYIEGVIH